MATYSVHSALVSAQTFGTEIEPDPVSGFDPIEISRQLLGAQRKRIEDAIEGVRRTWGGDFNAVEDADQDFENEVVSALAGVSGSSNGDEYTLTTLASTEYRKIYDPLGNEIGHDIVKYLATRPAGGAGNSTPVKIKGTRVPFKDVIAYVIITVSYKVD